MFNKHFFIQITQGSTTKNSITQEHVENTKIFFLLMKGNESKIFLKFIKKIKKNT